jgi:hypothetical protein
VTINVDQLEILLRTGRWRDAAQYLVDNAGSSGGYLSLTGAGETATPGAITQSGGFTVDDNGGGFNATTTGGIEFDDTSGAGVGITESGTGGVAIRDFDGTGGILVQSAGQTSVAAGTTLVLSSAGSVEITGTPITAIFSLGIGGFGIQCYAGDPSGHAVAGGPGDLCVDITNGKLYQATAAGAASWIERA